MTVEVTRVSPGWLDLRERADAAARAPELVGHLRLALPVAGVRIVHDLACGSGAMGRWLAPLLPGPQHWVLHDRDADLLALAESDPPPAAADGAAVTVETRLSDITQLEVRDLSGAAFVTASALLDLLTADELDDLIHLCVRACCPVLLALSVTGRVAFDPAHPLDAQFAGAFDAHQRRATTRGRLLGPDAVEAAADAFRRLGADVVVRPSPWRLGAGDAGLVAAWLDGWLGAACEQDATLAGELEPYRRRRLRELEAGRLAVTVGHADLLVLP